MTFEHIVCVKVCLEGDVRKVTELYYCVSMVYSIRMFLSTVWASAWILFLSTFLYRPPTHPHRTCNDQKNMDWLVYWFNNLNPKSIEKLFVV